MQRWTPKEYHIEGVKFLLQNSNAGLFWSPGCGKTSVVLATLAALKLKKMMKRTLVIAPRRPAKLVWPKEREKWTDFHGLTIDVLQGTPAKRDIMVWSSNADIIVITPDLLGWLMSEGRFEELNPDVLVVDESSYFREANTKRFKTLKPYLNRFSRRIILTATPAPKSYENLWSQAFILDQGGALGGYITHYRRLYFYNAAQGSTYFDWQLVPGAHNVINEKLRPLVLREDAVDHMDMPKLIRNVIPVELEPAARRIYDDMERQFCVAIEGKTVTAPTAAVLGGKLRQIANGFLYLNEQHDYNVIHDAKIEALKEFVEELQGNPVLILYEFNADRNRLMAAFPDAGNLGEGCTDKQADALCDAFNNGRLPILLAHPASAGHGLNLQGQAQHIVWFGPNWNLEFDEQATARVWRHGNPHERVFVHTFCVKDSIEEDVARSLASKDRSQKALLNALKRQPLDVVDAEVSTPS